ncbi:MAG: hypothetical protein CM1200mP20_02750 [Pseudomonadota bacterium]|nr:MAG: hypothetical protein CM1200mP20_02750 [Pseudomonadota bacterium]
MAASRVLLTLIGSDRNSCRRCASGGYQAVAVCLLNAYVNPAHEEALADLLAVELPDLRVSLSSRVTREFREFERASTTSLSAYVQPVVERYIDRFVKRLEGEGFTGRFSVMQSNGGRLPAEAMQSNAVTAPFCQGLPGGFDWCDPPGRALRLPEPDHLRHGRHVDRCLHGDGRQSAVKPRSTVSTACPYGFP